jgi:hypothetical protein
MDLRCPKCDSTDLKKVSLAYQEGLFHVDTRTRIRGYLFASGGPDVLVGRATTRGVEQTALSKSLIPPAKWSYLRLVLWSVGVSFLASIAYIRVVMTSPPPVSSLPVKLYVLIAPVLFAILIALFWRHIHSIYQRDYVHWDRSFICQRCGSAIELELDGTRKED